jgi:hypothetical protein
MDDIKEIIEADTYHESDYKLHEKTKEKQFGSKAKAVEPIELKYSD